MKKYVLLCFLCFCLHGLSHAQMYLKGYTGYALSTGNEKLTSSEEINGNNYASSYQLKFGQGLNLGLSIGYALNKNMALEITGNTQLFSKFKYSKNFIHDPEVDYYWSCKGFFGDLEYSSTMFQVSPQVVLRSDSYNQWTFYLKGGPDFAWATCRRKKQTIAYDMPQTSTHIPSYLETVKYSGSINTGLQYSFGTEYELSKNICVFAEFTTVNMIYTFKRSKILQSERDGVDVMSELESTSFYDWDGKIMFSHAGLNIGLKYTFK